MKQHRCIYSTEGVSCTNGPIGMQGPTGIQGSMDEYVTDSKGLVYFNGKLVSIGGDSGHKGDEGPVGKGICRYSADGTRPLWRRIAMFYYDMKWKGAQLLLSKIRSG